MKTPVSELKFVKVNEKYVSVHFYDYQSKICEFELNDAINNNVPNYLITGLNVSIVFSAPCKTSNS